MRRNKRISNNNAKPSTVKFFPLLLIIVAFFVLYEVTIRIIEPHFLPIRHVKIDATGERLNIANIHQQVNAHIKGFFSTDVMALKQRVLKEPFVDNVMIKRIWPDTLLVTLSELKLVARWGKDNAVTSHGEVLPVKLASGIEVPNFVGPEGQAQSMLDQYTEFSKMLLPHHLSIAELNLNQRHSWQITLGNGINVVLGRKDIVPHLASFISIYPRLKKTHGNHIDTIDLRHSNGFSLRLNDK